VRIVGGSVASNPIEVLNIAITSVSLKHVAYSVSSMGDCPVASSVAAASTTGRDTRVELIIAVCKCCVAVICKIDNYKDHPEDLDCTNSPLQISLPFSTVSNICQNISTKHI